MSEMLGNQYFMARNFEQAIQQLEQVLDREPDNENVQKKLIICYCEVGKVNAALNLFEKVIHEHIELIAETDLISEDCPCPELVKRMKWYEEVATSSFDFHCILGILNLYCNVDDSIAYFHKAAQISPQNKQISRLINAIKYYASHHAHH